MSSQSPTEQREVIQTHPRYAYERHSGTANLFQAFIEHVEYAVSEDGSSMTEHVWASRFLGTVTAAQKRKMGVQP